MNHFVSVITVNYNGLEDTLALLESLYTINTFPLEVIVVDNGSVADEAKIIKEKYPEAITVRSEKNLGFAGGNNLGIKKAKGDAMFFLNNDTVIREDGISHLVGELFSHESTGAVSPKILFHFPPRNIQFAGYTELTKYTLRNSIIGFDRPDSGIYNVVSESCYLHGAAMMVKKEVVEKAGMMPEIYFLYYEELDWCMRMRENGYRLIYNPAFTVYHKESRSTGQNSPFRTFYIVRNRLLFAHRNRKFMTKYIAVSYQLMFVLPKEILVQLFKGRSDNALSAIKAAISFFRMNKY